jgi:ABC-type multidrug transport system ATPase subunit
VSRRNLWSVILRTMSHRAVILTTHSMEEAEALCKRIGIMVQGQLRALGSKQHLKNKFGSGFELVVKLIVKDFERQLKELNAFVLGMFPSATVISENGGLIAYQIPKEEMKMGVAFTQLEANKTKLCIENYSVAQPTLEQVRFCAYPSYSSCWSSLLSLTYELLSFLQVFIRTVKRHTVDAAESSVRR